MKQYTAALPCLGSITSILNPDKDTNFLSDLVPNQTITFGFVIEFLRVSSERLERGIPMFKSAKQIEWASEIIGYAFIPPHSQYINEGGNYLRHALKIYESLLFNELEILQDEKSSPKATISQQLLNYADYSHQKILLKMLTQMTLLLEPCNFVDQKENSLIGDPRFRVAEHRVLFGLCSHVLRIYNKFIFKAYSYLYCDHWEYMIKLLLGLASHILKGISTLKNGPKIKFPDSIAMSIIELVYNAWMICGLKNEEIWTMLRDHILMLRNYHHGIVSYWSDICYELTAKTLINSKDFDPPELIIQRSKFNKIRCTNSQDLLIIKHNFTSRKDSQSGNNSSLFVQPFIFDLPHNQIQYLWSKFITMMNQINQNMTTSLTNIGSVLTQRPIPISPRTSLMISKSIKKVIELFLRQGADSKPQEETFVFSEREESIYEYRLDNKRRIIIEHATDHFKDLLDQMNYGFEQIHHEENHHQIEYSWRVNNGERTSKDSLFKLFEKILFDNARDTRSEYEDTRLDAICTLCMIFSRAKGPYYEETLKKFYQVLLKYLESVTSLENFQTLLEYITEIFLAGYLPNNMNLQKSLMNKLREFEKKSKEDIAFQGKPLERKSCNKFCSSSLSFISYENQADQYERTIKYLFSKLLKSAFKKDLDEFSLANSPNNLGRSSWNLMIFSILNNQILAFVNKVFEKLKWLEESSHSKLNELGIQILLVLGEINLGRLERLDTGWNEMFEDLWDSGLKIIEKIHQFIKTKIKVFEMSNSKSKKSENKLKLKGHISKAFAILYTWLCILIKLKEIAKESEKEMAVSMISRLVLITLQNYQNTTTFSNSIKGLISHILNIIQDSNSLQNNHLKSSAILNNNQETFDKWIDKSQDKYLLTIGIDQDTILSFYDPEIEKNDQVLLVVVRNMTGSFIWFGELKSKLETILEEPLKKVSSISQEMMLPSSDDIDDEYEEILSTKNQEERKEDRPDKMNAIRDFLSNAGIISRSNWNNLTEIPFDKNSEEALKKIDQTIVKCQILSSILYVQDPASEKLDEFPQSDILFQRFLDNMGAIIEDPVMQLMVYEELNRKPILYASNPLYEIIFSLPNFSASKLNNSSEPWESTAITVIWNAEDFAPYESPSYPRIINRLNLKGNNVAIIISPVNEDNYCLNILKEDLDLVTFSPVDSFVCPAKILASVIFQAVTSLSQKSQLEADNFETIFEMICSRENNISNLIQYYKVQGRQY